MLKVICISGKARHGKDTTADIVHNELENRGQKVLTIHYADALKYICKTYFNWNGEKDEAGRTLLQRVGTDIVRAQDPSFWVDEVVNVLKFFPNEWDYVIIPDCRFPNEVTHIAAFFDTIHIRVKRTNFITDLTEEQQNHISETALDNFPYDYLLVNNDMETLISDINKLIDSLFTY